MRAAPPSQGPPRDAFRAPQEILRASGKSSASSDLGQQPRAFTRPALAPPPEARAPILCQDGTRTHAPFRDGPRLVPAFVAQLLGQVMPDYSAALPRPAYGAADPPVALLLDRQS